MSPLYTAEELVRIYDDACKRASASGDIHVHRAGLAAVAAASERRGMLRAAEIADREPTRGGLYLAAAIRRAANSHPAQGGGR